MNNAIMSGMVRALKRATRKHNEGHYSDIMYLRACSSALHELEQLERLSELGVLSPTDESAYTNTEPGEQA